jgi:hypothetical protein
MVMRVFFFDEKKNGQICHQSQNSWEVALHVSYELLYPWGIAVHERTNKLCKMDNSARKRKKHETLNTKLEARSTKHDYSFLPKNSYTPLLHSF